MKKAIKLLLVILVLLILTLFMPFSFVSKKAKNNYEFIMKDSIENKNALVTKIKMLGAHDSFTEGIKLSSKPDPNETGIATNKYVNLFAKGLVVRMSKTQNVSATTMLNAGVRYFDVRVTKVDDKYYVCHGYLGKDILDYVKEMVDFLGNHDGEFIVFDLQHFYTADGANYELAKEDYEAFFDYVNNYKNDKNKSFLDYVHYNANADSLSNLTYEKVIGENAGIIVLAKEDGLSYAYYRDKDASYKEGRTYYSIRSFWHEDNNTSRILKGIEEEYNYIKEKGYEGIFIVNQAQKTGFILNQKMIRSLFSWSLLDMARDFNSQMIKDKDRFMKYLDAMPIYMADYVTSNKGDFNNLACKYIMEANKNL